MAQMALNCRCSVRQEDNGTVKNRSSAGPSSDQYIGLSVDDPGKLLKRWPSALAWYVTHELRGSLRQLRLSISSRTITSPHQQSALRRRTDVEEEKEEEEEKEKEKN